MDTYSFSSYRLNLGTRMEPPQIIPGPAGPGLIFQGETIHDPDNPLTEARKLVREAEAALKKPQPNLALVFGLGLGWHLTALRERYPDLRLIVFDPSEELKAIYAQNKVPLAGQAPLEILAQWPDLEKVISREVVYGKSDAPMIVILQGYRTLFPEATAIFEQYVQQEIMRRAVIDRTRNQTGQKFMHNLALNVRRFTECPDLTLLKGRLPARAAFIVGSGPSLDLNAVELKAVGAKGFIIAAASALKPLLHLGVAPNAVMVLESEDTSEFIRLSPEEQKILGDRCILALASGAHPAHFKVPGFHLGLFHLSSGVAQTFSRGLFLPQGGNSGSAAFSLAYLWGLKPLILVGQDQAYSGDRLHAERTLGSVEEENRGPAIEVAGVAGEMVETHSGLLASLNWFAEASKTIARQPNPPQLFNASAHGARVPGFTEAPLATLVASLSPVSGPLELASVLPKLPKPSLQEVTEDVRQLAGVVNTLRRMTSMNYKAARAEVRSIGETSFFLDQLLVEAKVAADKTEFIAAMNQADALMTQMLAGIQ